MTYTPSYKYIPPLEFHALTFIYDTACAVFGLGRGFQKNILGLIKIHPEDVVLDVGCGTAMFLKVMGRNVKFKHAYGVDPDPGALTIAQRRLTPFKNISLIRAFAEEIPLEEASVDLCFSTFAFHHFPTPIKLKAIQEIHRVLKPDGKVIITDFGRPASPLLKVVLKIGGKLEYMDGNLEGVIPQFLAMSGFHGIEVKYRQFPAIQSVVAVKI